MGPSEQENHDPSETRKLVERQQPGQTDEQLEASLHSTIPSEKKKVHGVDYLVEKSRIYPPDAE
jgi:hypothetical protein